MMNHMSDDDIAAEYDQLMAEGKEMEGLVRVRARVSKDPRSVYSVRLRFGELSEIMKAAEQRGLTISEFMRQASLAAARGEIDLKYGAQAQNLLAVREKARELYEAVEKLDDGSGTEGPA